MIWMLLVISCHGHTNARCVPIVEHFATKQECVAKIRTDYEIGFFEWKKKMTDLRDDAVCIPIPEPAYPTEQERNAARSEE